MCLEINTVATFTQLEVDTFSGSGNRGYTPTVSGFFDPRCGESIHCT